MNSTTFPEQRIQRWKDALGRIEKEILELHSNREVWQYLNEELPKQGDSIIHSTITRWYVDSHAAAVRRLTSNRSQDKGSLHRLLESIESHIDDFHGVQYDVVMTHDSVQEDLRALREAAKKVSLWADENVAHIGRVSSANPTFSDLDSIIDKLGEMLTKYTLALTGSYMPEVKPIIPYDWKLFSRLISNKS